MEHAGAIGIGAALLVASWACWAGRWRGWARVAVLPSMPITVAPGLGACLVAVGLGGVLPPVPRGILYALGLVAATVGLVLVLAEPRWWGPRWFRDRDRAAYDLSLPLNAAMAATVRGHLGPEASEALVRGQLPGEPLERWRAHLVSDEHGRPSAMQRVGLVRGHLLLYPGAIAFAADAAEDRMRGSAVVDVVPAGAILAANRVPAGTRPDGRTGPSHDLPSRVRPRLRIDTLHGPRVFETGGAARKAREIERRYGSSAPEAAATEPAVPRA